MRADRAGIDAAMPGVERDEAPRFRGGRRPPPSLLREALPLMPCAAGGPGAPARLGAGPPPPDGGARPARADAAPPPAVAARDRTAQTADPALPEAFDGIVLAQARHAMPAVIGDPARDAALLKPERRRRLGRAPAIDQHPLDDLTPLCRRDPPALR